MPPSTVPSRPRPTLPRTPSLAAGPFAVRASWGWEEHDGCLVGTVGRLGFRLGDVLRIRGRVRSVCLVSLPPAGAADGRGLYVNRGLRLRSGGLELARPVGARRVANDRPELDGYVVHATGGLTEHEVLELLSPPTVEALRRDDIGLEWEGRDLVLHAEGLTGRDTRVRMAAVGARIAAAIPRLPGATASAPEASDGPIAQP